MPVGAGPFRLGIDVEGSVDVGGPDNTSALAQVMSTKGLEVSARMRLDYDQNVSEASDGGRKVELGATAISGRFRSFVASRDFGPGDLAAVGDGGTVVLAVAPDGTVRDATGSPLGGFGLPVVPDLITGWPCPPLPDGGADPGSAWPAAIVSPGGTTLVGTASYEPGDLAGRHVLEVSADLEGDTRVRGVDLESVVTTLAGAELPDLHLSPMDLEAHVRTRNRCRFDAEDRSLVGWVVDATVGVTIHATSTAKYDAILDATTMSFEVSATATEAD